MSAQAASAEPARIVFLTPALDASSRAQLQDALYAQLSLVDAELVVLDHAEGRDPKELAQAERARAVLWLDTTSGDRWLLHIMDVRQGRKVVRRIDAREGQRSAALEAVAVLAREASRGGPLLEEPAATEPNEPPAEAVPSAPPVEEEPEPTAPEPEEPQPTGPDVDLAPPILRVALFYSGVYFTPESGFSHAAGLNARLDWQTGFFAGLSAGWAALAKPPGPLVVRRVPLGAAIGYRLNAHENLWVDLEAGFLVELLFRTTRGTGSSQADEMRVMAALAPRLRVEYRPVKLLGFFADLGLDVALTRPTYKAETESAETLLSPGLVRPAMEAGVAFYQ